MQVCAALEQSAEARTAHIPEAVGVDGTDTGLPGEAMRLGTARLLQLPLIQLEVGWPVWPCMAVCSMPPSAGPEMVFCLGASHECWPCNHEAPRPSNLV